MTVFNMVQDRLSRGEGEAVVEKMMAEAKALTPWVPEARSPAEQEMAKAEERKVAEEARRIQEEMDGIEVVEPVVATSTPTPTTGAVAEASSGEKETTENETREKEPEVRVSVNIRVRSKEALTFHSFTAHCCRSEVDHARWRAPSSPLSRSESIPQLWTIVLLIKFVSLSQAPVQPLADALPSSDEPAPSTKLLPVRFLSSPRRRTSSCLACQNLGRICCPIAYPDLVWTVDGAEWRRSSSRSAPPGRQSPRARDGTSSGRR